PQVTRIVIGHRERDRVARTRRPELGEILRQIADTIRASLRALTPVRIIGEKRGVLLHRRTTAGRVHDNRVHIVCFECGYHALRVRTRLIAASTMSRQGAATALPLRRDYLAAV